MSKLCQYEWSRNWYIRHRDDKGRYRKFSTGTDCKERAEQIKAEYDAKKAAPPTKEEQTINVLMDAYLADRKGVVSSYNSLKYAAVPIKEHFGQTQPCQITDLQVKQFIRNMQKLGRSDGNTIKQLNTLRSALSFGVKKNWIEKAPYIQFPPKPAPQDRWLTHREADKLLKACKSPHVKLFILLALKTGARKSAILQLTWDRVCVERDIIVYPLPGMNHGKKRRAIVPISPDLKKELIDACKNAQTNWVIEFRGKPLLDIKKGFASAREAAKIDHCTIHDLRRTCATWLVQAGIPTREIARMLGDTEEMISKVYGHHAPDYLMNAAKALDW